MSYDPVQDTDDPLGELVFQALERRELHGEAALEEMIRDHPGEAPALRQRLALLGSMGLLEGGGTQDHPERLGEFRLVRPLGAGGMGVVYLAVQERLGREVALKVLRPEHLYFPGARERLRREVETVARLQHPGIVPVFTVGEEQGVPYFAMELVRGASLAAVLERLQGRDPRSLSGRDLAPDGRGGGEAEAWLFSGSWEEACLRVIRQVAEALDYAHGRGILHRDVKPSNVMLVSEGASRAMLVDFGLAATGGQASRLTRSGSQLGSLHYMSPEQARGEVRALDERTDVYALGVTLYELLTLRRPFEGRSDTEVLLAIERGAVPPPRALNPKVSWEAETVCLTAMERDAARRYATAADLARDLSNALERRPIEARRAGAWLKARRWVERHPARATAALLGALIALGGPTVYAWQEHRSSLAITAQRDRARRSYAYAMQAIDRMLSKVGEVDLRFVPQMEPVRKAVLEDALALLERVVAEGGSPSESEPGFEEGRVQVADAHLRLGKLLADIGRSQEAVESYGRAAAILAGIPSERDESPVLVEKRVRASLDLAKSFLLAGRAGEAGPIHAEVEARLEREIARATDRGSLEVLRIANQAALASLQTATGEHEASRATFRGAAEAAEAVLKDHPGNTNALALASRTYNEYGLLLIARFTKEGERNEDALRVLERTVELGEELARLAPEDPLHRYALASARNNLGGALRRANDYARAGLEYETARGEIETLVRDFPSTWSYKQMLATVRNQLGLLCDYQEDVDCAETEYQAATTLLEELAEAAPREPSFAERLALARFNLSSMWRLKGELERAEEGLSRARQDAERTRELAPEDARPREILRDVLLALGTVQRARGDHRAAAETLEEVPRAHPDDFMSYKVSAYGLAECVEVVRRDEGLAEEERRVLELEYAERACRQIRALMERAKLPKKLREMLDYEPLRGLEPFERLVAEKEGQ